MKQSNTSFVHIFFAVYVCCYNSHFFFGPRFYPQKYGHRTIYTESELISPVSLAERLSMQGIINTTSELCASRP